MKILIDALSYPLRGNGKYMLAFGAGLSVIAYIASFAPLVGLLAYLFMVAYFCATYFKIVETTAVGEAQAPQFPDVSNMLEDLLWPMLKVVIVFVISFGPCIATLLVMGKEGETISDVLLILGVIYFPMAILAVIVLGYIGAVSPAIVIPSIFRAGWLYLLAVGFLLGIYFVEATVSETMEGYWIIGAPVMGLVGMYVLMVSGRTLGLIYQAREEELSWL